MAAIVWIHHASVLLKGEKTVYIDPWKLKQAEPADLVLITHDHYDHLSTEDLERVAQAETEILVPEPAVKKLRGVKGKIRGVRAGMQLTAAGLGIEVVPAYNVGKAFHPKSAGHVGYVVTIDGERIYHAGDTDRTAEMKGLKPDVALVPVGGTYTMDAKEAAQAVADLQARRAIPIHYGDIVGGAADAAEFKKLCKVPVEILEPRD